MIRRNVLSLIGLAMVLFYVTPSASYEGKVFFSTEVGKCNLIVETADDSHSFRLRVHPEGEGCNIDKESMSSALEAAFSKADAPKLEGIRLSLCIGRLIDYPWLSQYLAAAASKDPAWDRKRGKPVTQDINKYVSNILSRSEVTSEIEKIFVTSGYRVISTTVEKVCVGSVRDVLCIKERWHGERCRMTQLFGSGLRKNKS